MAIELPPLKINNPAIQALRGIVGMGNFSVANVDRLAYGRDMWPRSLIWLRDGKVKYAPDCIVWPENTEQILEVYSLARNFGLPVIPFGAGSGVCAGALPLRGGIIVDTKKMNAIRRVDTESLIAEVESGIIGQNLEMELNYQGFSMGHFPSSIYCSTLGGYLAARSAGQMSSKYGKIEDMVASLEAVLPNGQIIKTPFAPARCAFPDLNQLLVGSEGTLGIITSAWMKIHPLPSFQIYRGMKFSSLENGLEAMREIMQLGLRPAVLRLYDEFDSLVFKSHEEGEQSLVESLAKTPLWRRTTRKFLQSAKKGSLSSILRYPGLINRFTGILPGSCLLIMIFEDEKEKCEMENDLALQVCRYYKGNDLGEAPGKSWLKHRYSVSYKQSGIFDAGAFVDTMEVACPWSLVPKLYYEVCKALSNKVFVMAHFSHAYHDGCCIYFSFVGYASNEEKIHDLYQNSWTSALETVHKNGGTLSHHHGVGMHKAFFMNEEHGEFMKYFRRLKSVCDPGGILNPGKLDV